MRSSTAVIVAARSVTWPKNGSRKEKKEATTVNLIVDKMVVFKLVFARKQYFKLVDDAMNEYAAKVNEFLHRNRHSELVMNFFVLYF